MRLLVPGRSSTRRCCRPAIWSGQPETFRIQRLARSSVRYIDFDSGNDANDGLAKQSPWKHHPWDPTAKAQALACKGVHTYVFKQGVDYRGELNADESVGEHSPIILTRDPFWGEGPAVFCGSEAVTGWKQGADNDPHPGARQGLACGPRLGAAQRFGWSARTGAVARHRAGPHAQLDHHRPARHQEGLVDLEEPRQAVRQLRDDQRPTPPSGVRQGTHINESKPQDYYDKAIVWTTKGWVMGNPYPARVLAVDRKNGSLVFPGQWGGTPSYKIIRGCQYYLEDKPQYLDSPGEFWFDKKGSGGRLYVRLPGDQDPNQCRVEVARRIHAIDSRGMSHVHISGLTFSLHECSYWNLTAAPYWVSHESIDVEPGCVRLLGSGTDITMTHCVFEHVLQGVRLRAMGKQDSIDGVVVSDNVFSDADSGGVELSDGSAYGDVEGPMGRLYDVRVLRNKFDHIGMRPDLFGQGVSLQVQYAQTAEVAGNIFDRV